MALHASRADSGLYAFSTFWLSGDFRHGRPRYTPSSPVWWRRWPSSVCLLVAAVFVYWISVESGQFAVVKQSIAGLSSDRRIQVLLIAFSFGALLVGAGGDGAPVAITEP